MVGTLWGSDCQAYIKSFKYADGESSLQLLFLKKNITPKKRICRLGLHGSCHRACLIKNCIAFSLISCRKLTSNQEVLLTHGDSITQVADGFKAVAHSGSCVAG